MIEFFYKLGGTILVSVLLIILVIFIVKKMLTEKSTCGCGCKDCPSNNTCSRYRKYWQNRVV